MKRVREVLPSVHLQQALDRKDVMQLREDFDFVVIASGAQKPRTLPVPGNERLITALEFLQQTKTGKIKPGKRVVIIGAGNVGCDVATEAHRLGAEDITLIDIQEPASFGTEREAAEAVGANFMWPRFTKEITDGRRRSHHRGTAAGRYGRYFHRRCTGARLSCRPKSLWKMALWWSTITHQTTDPKIFAVGDVVRPGLLTDAIGAGRKVAQAISEIIEGRRPAADARQMIDRRRVSLEYFDPRITSYEDTAHCGSQCSSCGACRDCGVCIAVCPYNAISREDKGGVDYEYVVDESRCIGCGFCAGACPCGIWDLVVNTPMG